MTERLLTESREVKQCRICLQTDDPYNIVSPCDCKGSIQYVHLNCLKQYLSHRFKTATTIQRRKMKRQISCQICKKQIHNLKVQSNRRCAKCSQLHQDLQAQDIFFLVVFMILYIGFHVVGVIIIVQDSLIAKIIGSFWLGATIIGFNYGLYKIIKKLFMVRDAEIMEY